MPFQIIHIPLSGQQDDKTARLSRGPNVLRKAVNVGHRIRGELRKRRGFTRITTTGTVDGSTPEAVFVAVAERDGELVLVGRDSIYSVAANDNIVDTEALVLRGPSMVGNYKLGTIHVSPISES